MTITVEQQKANRKLWVEALRSGEFEQAKDWLYCDGGYCCLGVLAKVQRVSDKRMAGRSCLLDFPSVMEAVGLRESEGGFETTDRWGVEDTECLSNLNDSGATFEQIADIIESEPPGLFTS